MDYIDAKTILTKSKKPSSWFGCDYGTNLYRGCSHGCIYCDSRSECYQIEDFDKIYPKREALTILEKELSKKRKKGIIGTGAMSDPYNPLEKSLELTRGLLQLAARYRFGVCIYTKSTLVTRDIDLLKQIKEHSAAVVCMTITTFDDNLCKILEPNAPVTSERFKALAQLKKAGITTGIILMPLLPWINDTKENIQAIIQEAASLSLDFIMPFFGVTLRDRQRAFFYQHLDKNFPALKQQYHHKFQNSYACHSPNHKELYSMFNQECKKHNLKYRMKDIINLYKTEKESYEVLQLDL